VDAPRVISAERPVCLITTTVIPLDANGRPDPTRTVTVSGVGGVVVSEEQLTATWFSKRGVACTISGNPEVLR
jgi:hypothetical protein